MKPGVYKYIYIYIYSWGVYNNILYYIYIISIYSSGSMHTTTRTLVRLAYFVGWQRRRLHYTHISMDTSVCILARHTSHKGYEYSTTR